MFKLLYRELIHLHYLTSRGSTLKIFKSENGNLYIATIAVGIPVRTKASSSAHSVWQPSRTEQERLSPSWKWSSSWTGGPTAWVDHRTVQRSTGFPSWKRPTIGRVACTTGAPSGQGCTRWRARCPPPWPVLGRSWPHSRLDTWRLRTRFRTSRAIWVYGWRKHVCVMHSLM